MSGNQFSQSKIFTIYIKGKNFPRYRVLSSNMAPAFSKPVVNARPAGSRKRKISAALSSSDNVDPTAIKKRKLAAAATEAQRLAALKAKCRASVEDEDSQDDQVSHVGRHAPEGVLLQPENIAGDDDDPAPPLEEVEDDDEEDDNDDEEMEVETEEEEIGINIVY